MVPAFAARLVRFVVEFQPDDLLRSAGKGPGEMIDDATGIGAAHDQARTADAAAALDAVDRQIRRSGGLGIRPRAPRARSTARLQAKVG